MWSTLRQKLQARLARRARVKADRQGFTLVEIMMVMVILAVGVLPIAVIQHQARREVNQADRQTQAIAVAQMQLERMKSMGFGQAVAGNGTVGNVTWVSQVQNVSFGLDRLTVTASWREKSDVQSLTVSDLVSMR